MFVVTVTFRVYTEKEDAFRAAVKEQARLSLEREDGCVRFDVCSFQQDPARFFLYEIYTDEAAFQAHLDTDHFKAFDAQVTPWTVSKVVEVWDLEAV